MGELRAAPTGDVTSCPGCRASVRPGAPFCTLCHQDLRPPPEPARRPVLVPAQSGSTDEPVPAEPAGWPCSCGTANPMAASTCAACGQGFLTQLRGSEPPLLELPVLGDVSRLSRVALSGIAAGVVLTVLLLVFLLGLVTS